MHAKLLLAALVVLGCSSSAPAPLTPANQSTSSPIAEGVQYVGNPAASVAITYYFDYLCPHCYASAPRFEGRFEEVPAAIEARLTP